MEHPCGPGHVRVQASCEERLTGKHINCWYAVVVTAFIIPIVDEVIQLPSWQYSWNCLVRECIAQNARADGNNTVQ